MAGFLDSKEQVIDMVLTDVGRGLLFKGDLRFRYWIPYDDEIDYNPQATLRFEQQNIQDRIFELIESPLVKEATLGYRGLNLRGEDTTNVNRPMYSAPPGVGQNFSLPQAQVDKESVTISLDQKKLSKLYEQKDLTGREVVKTEKVDVGFQRFNGNEELVNASFPPGSFPEGTHLEGFLVTVYLSSSISRDENGNLAGGLQEVLSNRDSSGNIVYRNDLHFNNYTP